MKITHLLLIVLLLNIASAEIFEEENRIVILNSENFDKAREVFDYLVVKFYLPTCRHCKQLAPHYLEASRQMAESHPQMKFAQVDCTFEGLLSDRFKIEGVPVLLLFKKGESGHVEFKGYNNKAHDIISWIDKQTRVLITEMHSVEEIARIAKNETVGLFLGPTNAFGYQQFVEAAGSFTEDMVFLRSNDDDVKANYGITTDTFIVFTNSSRDINVFNDPATVENIQDFLNVYRSPYFIPFNQYTANRLFESDLDIVFFIAADDTLGIKALEAFKEAAFELRNSMLTFCIAKMEDELTEQLATYIGIKQGEIPAIRLVQPANNTNILVLTQKITIWNVKKFVGDFKKGTLKPFYISEVVPKDAYENDVRIIVGKNFGKIVNDKYKDVLVLYYSPWCQESQDFLIVYENLAKKLKHNKNLVIAKMNIDANEVADLTVEQFPTLKFYPKSNKMAPIEFWGEKSEEELIEYIFKYTTIKLTVKNDEQ